MSASRISRNKTAWKNKLLKNAKSIQRNRCRIDNISAAIESVIERVRGEDETFPTKTNNDGDVTGDDEKSNFIANDKEKPKITRSLGFLNKKNQKGGKNYLRNTLSLETRSKVGGKLYNYVTSKVKDSGDVKISKKRSVDPLVSLNASIKAKAQPRAQDGKFTRDPTKIILPIELTNTTVQDTTDKKIKIKSPNVKKNQNDIQPRRITRLSLDSERMPTLELEFISNEDLEKKDSTISELPILCPIVSNIETESKLLPRTSNRISRSLDRKSNPDNVNDNMVSDNLVTVCLKKELRGRKKSTCKNLEHAFNNETLPLKPLRSLRSNDTNVETKALSNKKQKTKRKLVRKNYVKRSSIAVKKIRLQKSKNTTSEERKKKFKVKNLPLRKSMRNLDKRVEEKELVEENVEFETNEKSINESVVNNPNGSIVEEEPIEKSNSSETEEVEFASKKNNSSSLGKRRGRIKSISNETVVEEIKADIVEEKNQDFLDTTSFSHLRTESTNSSFDSGKENTSVTPVNVHKPKVGRPRKNWTSRRDKSSKKTLNNVIGILTEGINIPVDSQESVVLTVQTSVDNNIDSLNQQQQPNDPTGTNNNSNTNNNNTEQVNNSDLPCQSSQTNGTESQNEASDQGQCSTANDIILDLSRRKQTGKGSFLEKIVSKIAKQKDALLEGEVGSLLDNAAEELTNILEEVGPNLSDSTENLNTNESQVLNLATCSSSNCEGVPARKNDTETVTKASTVDVGTSTDLDVSFDNLDRCIEAVVANVNSEDDNNTDDNYSERSVPIPRVNLNVPSVHNVMTALNFMQQSYHANMNFFPHNQLPCLPNNLELYKNSGTSMRDNPSFTDFNNPIRIPYVPRRPIGLSIEEQITQNQLNIENLIASQMFPLNLGIEDNETSFGKSKRKSKKRPFDVDPTLSNKKKSIESEEEPKETTPDEVLKLDDIMKLIDQGKPEEESDKIQCGKRKVDEIDTASDSFVDSMDEENVKKLKSQNDNEGSEILESFVPTEVSTPKIIDTLIDSDQVPTANVKISKRINRRKSFPEKKLDYTERRVSKRKSLPDEVDPTTTVDDNENKDIVMRRSLRNKTALEEETTLEVVSQVSEVIENNEQSNETGAIEPVEENKEIVDKQIGKTMKKRGRQKKSLADEHLLLPEDTPSFSNSIVEEESLNVSQKRGTRKKLDQSIAEEVPTSNFLVEGEKFNDDESNRRQTRSAKRKDEDRENPGDDQPNQSLADEHLDLETNSETLNNNEDGIQKTLTETLDSPPEAEDFQTPKKRPVGNFAVVHTKSGEILIVEKKKKLTKEAAKFFCDVCTTSFTRKSSLKKHNSSQSHLSQIGKLNKDKENDNDNLSTIETVEPVIDVRQSDSLEDQLLDEEICKITENMSHDEYVLTDHLSPVLPESSSTPQSVENSNVGKGKIKTKQVDISEEHLNLDNPEPSVTNLIDDVESLKSKGKDNSVSKLEVNGECLKSDNESVKPILEGETNKKSKRGRGRKKSKEENQQLNGGDLVESNPTITEPQEQHLGIESKELEVKVDNKILNEDSSSSSLADKPLSELLLITRNENNNPPLISNVIKSTTGSSNRININEMFEFDSDDNSMNTDVSADIQKIIEKSELNEKNSRDDIDIGVSSTIEFPISLKIHENEEQTNTEVQSSTDDIKKLKERKSVGKLKSKLENKVQMNETTTSDESDVERSKESQNKCKIFKSVFGRGFGTEKLDKFKSDLEINNQSSQESNDERKNEHRGKLKGRKKHVASNTSNLSNSRCRQSKKRAEERISRAFDDSPMESNNRRSKNNESQIDKQNRRSEIEEKIEVKGKSKGKSKNIGKGKHKGKEKPTDEEYEDKFETNVNNEKEDLSKIQENDSSKIFVSDFDFPRCPSSGKDSTRLEDNSDDDDDEEDDYQMGCGRMSPIFAHETPGSSLQSSSSEAEDNDCTDPIICRKRSSSEFSGSDKLIIRSPSLGYKNVTPTTTIENLPEIIETKRPGKVLNFDEELFVECCSRLKATTENELRGAKKIKLDQSEAFHKKDEPLESYLAGRDRWRDVESQNSLGSLLESVNQLLGEEMYSSSNRERDYAKRGIRHSRSEHSSRSPSPDISRLENPGYEDSLDVAFEHNNKLRDKIQQRMRESESLIASTFGQRNYIENDNHETSKINNVNSSGSTQLKNIHETTSGKMTADSTTINSLGGFLDGALSDLLHSNGKHDHNGSTPMNVLAELACARAPSTTSKMDITSLKKLSPKTNSSTKESFYDENSTNLKKTLPFKKSRNPIKELFERKKELNVKKQLKKSKPDVKLNSQKHENKMKKIKKRQDFPLIRRNDNGGLVEKKKRREIERKEEGIDKIKDVYDFEEEESLMEPVVSMSYRNRGEKNNENDLSETIGKTIEDNLSNNESEEKIETEKFAPKTKGALKSYNSEEKREEQIIDRNGDSFDKRQHFKQSMKGKKRNNNKNSKRKSKNSWYENDSSDEFRTAIKTAGIGVRISKSQRTCSKGKQNLFAELSTSSDSEFENNTKDNRTSVCEEENGTDATSKRIEIDDLNSVKDMKDLEARDSSENEDDWRDKSNDRDTKKSESEMSEQALVIDERKESDEQRTSDYEVDNVFDDLYREDSSVMDSDFDGTVDSTDKKEEKELIPLEDALDLLDQPTENVVDTEENNKKETDVISEIERDDDDDDDEDDEEDEDEDEDLEDDLSKLPEKLSTDKKPAKESENLPLHVFLSRKVQESKKKKQQQLKKLLEEQERILMTFQPTRRQRKCAIGKQGLLAEISSSDEESFAARNLNNKKSNEKFDAEKSKKCKRESKEKKKERYIEKKHEQMIAKEQKAIEDEILREIGKKRDTPNLDLSKQKKDCQVENDEDIDLDVLQTLKKKSSSKSKKSKNKTSSNGEKKHRLSCTNSRDTKERRTSNGRRESDDEELKTTKSWNKVEEGVGVAIGRRKRTAANQLYYWSSSSDEEDVVESTLAIEEEDDDRQEQHGWIVGDSHKKMITMLAMEKQLKEKRRRSEDEFEPSKGKSKKHRNSTS